MRTRMGQAVIELCLGIVAIMVIVSAFYYFARHMAKSLEVQNHLRQRGATYSARVKVEDSFAKEVFGRETLNVNEPHGVVNRTIPQTWPE